MVQREACSCQYTQPSRRLTKPSLGPACWQKPLGCGFTNQLTTGSAMRRCETSGGLNKEKSSKRSAMAGELARAALSSKIGQQFLVKDLPRQFRQSTLTVMSLSTNKAKPKSTLAYTLYCSTPNVKGALALVCPPVHGKFKPLTYPSRWSVSPACPSMRI